MGAEGKRRGCEKIEPCGRQRGHGEVQFEEEGEEERERWRRSGALGLNG